jgi:hypothetical protein
LTRGGKRIRKRREEEMGRDGRHAEKGEYGKEL